MPKPLRRPRSRISVWSVMWLVWAALVSVVLAGALVAVPAQIVLPRNIVYPGVLSSGGAPQLVTLPSGAILKEVLVNAGDEVVVGQTLGVLDTSAMEQVLNQLKVDFLVARSVRRCFANRGAQTLPPPAHLTDEADQIAVTAGVDQCRLEFQTRADAAKHLGQEIAHLVERRGLIQRRFDLHMADPVPDDPAKARVAVDLMLARNGLDAQLLLLKQQQSTQAQENEDFRLNRIVELADEIARIIALQARLVSYLSDPRLTAPSDGVILHVRAPIHSLGHSERAEDVDVITLRADTSAPPHLSIRVPREHLSTLDTQSMVRVVAKGLPGWDAPFDGQMSVEDRYIPNGDTASAVNGLAEVAVPIRIDESVAEALKNLPVFNQAGGEAQADVTVRLGSQPLNVLLSQEAKTLPLQRIVAAVERRAEAVKAALAL